ncbi:MAG: lysine--tRNA ligase [Alphaproteobacteria bacterium]
MHIPDLNIRPDYPVMLAAKAWPFEEARKLINRLQGKTPAKGHVLFETGYGPSGLPHIGTFGEVVRTSMVRHAFAEMTGIPTRLVCFSDDMDGLRKVPDNVPNGEMLRQHLGKPLTKVPDPFGEYESFGHHNNARLKHFLDSFGFEYEFTSSTLMYQSGAFDEALKKILLCYDQIMALMLPTLGEERQQTYSPFLPISPSTGKVLQVPILEKNLNQHSIVFEDEDGKRCEVPVTGGHCKLQWKPDWAMRWYALQVDYEMAGKDLTPSVQVAGKIVEALGGKPPENLAYELFLDQHGHKISKSKGNGLSIEEWLRYAPAESLSYFMHQQPKRAKRLYFDVIPRAVDEYITFVEKYPAQEKAAQYENPAFHVHAGNVPALTLPLSFGMLLNLASVVNADDKSVLWGFISRYSADASPEKMPYLDQLCGHAVAYYQDYVRPHKLYRLPDEREKLAMTELLELLRTTQATTGEELQSLIFEIGKKHGFEPLRDWFKALYETLLGQSEGPRFGSFIELYGIKETIALLENTLQEVAA